mmetsp:Transcript_4063/g.13343  ORF Transcript_4063/g.13343 Transcript_4063/m.13343 type:complete len:236 (-) Transcript_4063:518-1225(-)
MPPPVFVVLDKGSDARSAGVPACGVDGVRPDEAVEEVVRAGGGAVAAQARGGGVSDLLGPRHLHRRRHRRVGVRPREQVAGPGDAHGHRPRQGREDQGPHHGHVLLPQDRRSRRRLVPELPLLLPLRPHRTRRPPRLQVQDRRLVRLRRSRRQREDQLRVRLLEGPPRRPGQGRRRLLLACAGGGRGPHPRKGSLLSSRHATQQEKQRRKNILPRRHHTHKKNPSCLRLPRSLAD